MSFDMSRAVAALMRMLDGKKEPAPRKPAQPLEQDLRDTWQELSTPPIPKRKPRPPVLLQEQAPPIPARKPVAPATRDFADTLPGRMFLGGGATGQWTPGDAVTKLPDTGTFLPVQPHGQYPGDFVESPQANRQTPVFTSPRPQGMGGGLFGNTPMGNTINNVWNTIIETPADHAAQDDIKKIFPNGMNMAAAAKMVGEELRSTDDDSSASGLLAFGGEEKEPTAHDNNAKQNHESWTMSNLRHFLAGTGDVRPLSMESVRQKGFIKRAESKNRARFKYKTFSGESGRFYKQVEGLKDGEERKITYDRQRLPMYWGSAIGTDKGIAVDIDTHFGTGKTNLLSRIDEGTLRRDGDIISLHGRVVHRWYDIYDFEGGLEFMNHLPHPTNEFAYGASWEQPLSAKIKIDPNGKLTPLNIVWGDIHPRDQKQVAGELASMNWNALKTQAEIPAAGEK